MGLMTNGIRMGLMTNGIRMGLMTNGRDYDGLNDK